MKWTAPTPPSPFPAERQLSRDLPPLTQPLRELGFLCAEIKQAEVSLQRVSRPGWVGAPGHGCWQRRDCPVPVKPLLAAQEQAAHFKRPQFPGEAGEAESPESFHICRGCQETALSCPGLLQSPHQVGAARDGAPSPSHCSATAKGKARLGESVVPEREGWLRKQGALVGTN